MGESHEGRQRPDSHPKSINAWTHFEKGHAQMEKLQQVLHFRPDSVDAQCQR